MRKFFYTRFGTFHVEIGKLPRITLGIEFGAGDGDEITINVGFGYQLYLSYGAHWICKVWRHSREVSVDLWFRGFDLSYMSMSIDLYGGDDDHYNRVRKYYFYPIGNLLDIILGERIYSSVDTPCDNVIFDMPEAQYMAKVKIVDCAWKRPLSPFIKRARSVDFDFGDVGIPVEGKGENSWDCGMDAIFSCSMGIEKDESVREARDKEILSIIKTRMRRSSMSHYTLEALAREGYYVGEEGYMLRDHSKKQV